MSDALREVIILEKEALNAIATASDAASLEAVRIAFLSRKGRLPALMARLGSLAPPDRPAFGKEVNRVKVAVEAAFESRKSAIGAPRAPGAAVDVTLPGRRPVTGKLHPITRTIREILRVFRSLGFEPVEGPEIEDEFHNFNALNIPPDHPARAESDNFYIRDDLLLRSQTSTVQIRTMESRRPPLRVVAPGRVFRPDTVDATHHYMFHQVEGLAVDRDLTLADLKATLLLFARGLFGESVDVRLRPSFFPFTEPSAEMDMTCVFCKGSGCPTCKKRGWIELGGCGMVDPNVFYAVGYDPDVYTGFAFGLGIERMVMTLYGVPDIRLLFENDVRFLEQI
jgi:phenylalanyl-tRNA synthetase alpha chain